MQESTQGGFTPDEAALAFEDSNRARAEAQRKQSVLRRQGHKGSKTWGYATPSKGKGKR